MNRKIKGIMLSVGTIIFLVILTIMLSAIIAATSSDPWIGLGVATIMLIGTGIVMVVLLIVGIVQYSKHKSELGLGIIYGIAGMVMVIVAISIFITIYNMLV